MQITLSLDTKSVDLRNELLDAKALLDVINRGQKLYVTKADIMQLMDDAKQLDHDKELYTEFKTRGWPTDAMKITSCHWVEVATFLREFIARQQFLWHAG